MKKNLSLMLLIFATLINVVKGEEISLPIISKPAQLEEGTYRTLTDAQINELLPWAKTSKSALNDLLLDIKDMNMKDKINHLSVGIADIVKESKPSTELFMRYVLNRGLILQETLKNETDENSVGISDAQLRILVSSVNMALKYYDVDSKMLNNNSSMSFASFGANYFNFLQNLNKSIFDASAQFEFNKITLEWLAWDLYRDLHNKTYAPQITKIHKFLKQLPAKDSDSKSLVQIRKMRDLQEKLEISSIMTAITDKTPSRELKVGEKVLVASKTNGQLREAIIYANVSSDVPGNDKENNNSHYCIKFLTAEAGERFMAYENFVKRSDIHLAAGCGDKFCVGEQVIESKTGAQFAIKAITNDGDYVIRSVGNKMELIVEGRDLMKSKLQ